MDGKKLKVDLMDVITNQVTCAMDYPPEAEELIKSIEDIELNDAINGACACCLHEGFKAGLKTAMNLMQGKTDIEIEL